MERRNPSVEDVLRQLQVRKLPVCMVTMGTEAALRAEILATDPKAPIGGLLKRTKTGVLTFQSSEHPSEQIGDHRYKLCHIERVGFHDRRTLDQIELPTIEARFRSLLHPRNMFVIPHRYAGLGECEPFIAAFRG